MVSNSQYKKSYFQQDITYSNYLFLFSNTIPGIKQKMNITQQTSKYGLCVTVGPQGLFSKVIPIFGIILSCYLLFDVLVFILVHLVHCLDTHVKVPRILSSSLLQHQHEYIYLYTYIFTYMCLHTYIYIYIHIYI